MSDPVTNVEIEDVLSSIRRLVSNGDKARVEDAAQDDKQQDRDKPTSAEGQTSTADWFVDTRAEEAAEPTQTAPDADEAPAPADRFVLTPAFLVSDDASLAEDNSGAAEAEAPQHSAANDRGAPTAWPDETRDPEVDSSSDSEADAPWAGLANRGDDHPDEDEDQWQVDEDAVATPEGAQKDEASDDAPLTLTNMVFDEAEDEPAAAPPEGTDRSELVATIAELEAAVSRDAHDFEPDGSETAAETIAWPGAIARQFTDADDAETLPEGSGDAEDGLQAEDSLHRNEHAQFDARDTASVETAEDMASDDVALNDVAPDDVAPDNAPADDVADSIAFLHRTNPEVGDDDFDDDDLDENLDDLMSGSATVDEEALRALVSQVVREELTGPLGERITRNVRKLVRREIYRILSSQEFD
ncbi:hypothetical protein [Pseudooctadecabacter sp.]|uniref:hypothetical protein n=1 Tax=Pseudooctadecabacter sp. TaxID=1966338 RepID=UPI0025E104EE|nr:hypothetical protein [Pseudooctadecabacter sp.]